MAKLTGLASQVFILGLARIRISPFAALNHLFVLYPCRVFSEDAIARFIVAIASFDPLEPDEFFAGRYNHSPS